MAKRNKKRNHLTKRKIKSREIHSYKKAEAEKPVLIRQSEPFFYDTVFPQRKEKSNNEYSRKDENFRTPHVSEPISRFHVQKLQSISKSPATNGNSFTSHSFLDRDSPKCKTDATQIVMNDIYSAQCQKQNIDLYDEINKQAHVYGHDVNEKGKNVNTSFLDQQTFSLVPNVLHEKNSISQLKTEVSTIPHQTTKNQKEDYRLFYGPYRQILEKKGISSHENPEESEVSILDHKETGCESSYGLKKAEKLIEEKLYRNTNRDNPYPTLSLENKMILLLNEENDSQKRIDKSVGKNSQFDKYKPYNTSSSKNTKNINIENTKTNLEHVISSKKRFIPNIHKKDAHSIIKTDNLDFISEMKPLNEKYNPTLVDGSYDNDILSMRELNVINGLSESFIHVQPTIDEYKQNKNNFFSNNEAKRELTATRTYGSCFLSLKPHKSECTSPLFVQEDSKDLIPRDPTVFIGCCKIKSADINDMGKANLEQLKHTGISTYDYLNKHPTHKNSKFNSIDNIKKIANIKNIGETRNQGRFDKIRNGEISEQITRKEDILRHVHVENNDITINPIQSSHQFDAKKFWFHSNFDTQKLFVQKTKDFNFKSGNSNHKKLYLSGNRTDNKPSHDIHTLQRMKNVNILKRENKDPYFRQPLYKNDFYKQSWRTENISKSSHGFYGFQRKNKHKRIKFETPDSFKRKSDIDHELRRDPLINAINKSVTGTFYSTFSFQLDLFSHFYHNNEPLTKLIGPVLDAIRTKKGSGIFLIAERLIEFLKIEYFHDFRHSSSVSQYHPANHKTLNGMANTEKAFGAKSELLVNDKKDNDLHYYNTTQDGRSYFTQKITNTSENKTSAQFSSNVNVLMKHINMNQYKNIHEKASKNGFFYHIENENIDRNTCGIFEHRKGGNHIGHTPQDKSQKFYSSSKKHEDLANLSGSYHQNFFAVEFNHTKPANNDLTNTSNISDKYLDAKAYTHDAIRGGILNSTIDYQTLNLSTVLNTLYLAYQYLKTTNHSNLYLFEGLLPELLEYKKFLESEIEKAERIIQHSNSHNNRSDSHIHDKNIHDRCEQKDSIEQENGVDIKGCKDEGNGLKQEQTIKYHVGRRIEPKEHYSKENMKTIASSDTIEQEIDKTIEEKSHITTSKSQANIDALKSGSLIIENPSMNENITRFGTKKPDNKHDMRDFRYKCIIEDPNVKSKNTKVSMTKDNAKETSKEISSFYSLSYYLINRYYLKQLLIILAKYHERKSEQLAEGNNRSETGDKTTANSEAKMIDYYTKTHLILLISSISLSPNTYEQPFLLFQIANCYFKIKNYPTCFRILSLLSQMVRNNGDALCDIYSLMAEVLYYLNIYSCRSPLLKSALYLRTILKFNPGYQPAQYKLIEMTLIEIERTKKFRSEQSDSNRTSHTVKKSNKKEPFNNMKSYENITKYNKSVENNSRHNVEECSSFLKNYDNTSVEADTITHDNEPFMNYLNDTNNGNHQRDVVNEHKPTTLPTVTEDNTHSNYIFSIKEKKIVSSKILVAECSHNNRNKLNNHHAAINHHLCSDYESKTADQNKHGLKDRTKRRAARSDYQKNMVVQNNHKVGSKIHFDECYPNQIISSEKDDLFSRETTPNSSSSPKKHLVDDVNMTYNTKCDLISYNNLIIFIKKLPYSSYSLYYFLYCLYMRGDYHLVNILIKRRVRNDRSKLTISEWMHKHSYTRVKEAGHSISTLQSQNNPEIEGNSPAFKFKDCSTEFYINPLDPYFEALHAMATAHSEKRKNKRGQPMNKLNIQRQYYWFRHGWY